MLIVFAYHNFCKGYGGRDTHLYVDMDRFLVQADFLKRRFENFIFLKDYVASYDQLKNETFASITVDDGIDNFNLAYDHFRVRGLKVNLFVSSDKIGTEEYSTDLNENIGYLKKEDLLNFEPDIVDIQNHGASHRDLSKISTNEYGRELLGSKKNVERIMNKKINFFCYPYGKYNPRIVAFLKGSGYLGACASISGTNESLNPFEIKRIPVASYDNGNDLEAKISAHENK